MGLDLFGTKKAQKTQVAIANAQAAQAQQDEADRQARIQQGRSAIDQAFGQFDDGYFTKFRNAYGDYYNPQIDKQYERAQDKLKAQLAGQGILESGVGNQAFADLAGTYSDNKASISKQADAAVNGLRGNINNAKTSLYTADAAAGDPGQIASQATATATALAQPQAYSPLADLFAGALNSYGAYRQSQAIQGNTGGGGSFTPDFLRSQGGNSGGSGTGSSVYYGQ